MNIEGIPCMEDHDFPVINICSFMDKMWPDWLETMGPDWEEQGRVLKDFCEKHNGHYYGRPREDFFIFEAVDEAKAEGKQFVIVEDMS